MNLNQVLLVGAGGFVGSIARFLLARTIDSRLSSLLPYGTLVVNVTGSFILGLVFAATLKNPQESEIWRLLLGVGFCGGFTTFSTFALENVLMLQQKNYGEFLLYTAVSLVFCLIGTGLGLWIGNKVWWLGKLQTLITFVALSAAQVAKLVDALLWGGSARKGVLVRVQFWALINFRFQISNLESEIWNLIYRSGGIGRHARFRGVCRKTWGFESLLRYSLKSGPFRVLFYFQLLQKRTLS